jgi:membrane fusion protein (multidrug efflux system)
MQVVSVPVTREAVEETISLVGTVAANEQVEIRAEAEGFVERILFEEGQRVEAGAPLVALDETSLQAALEEAEAALQLSQQTFERSRELVDAKLISNQEFDQASSRLAADQAAVAGRQRALREARVVAPFGGVIGARRISPGQLVNRTTALTWLVDLDPVKVEFNVPERFLSQVRSGQTLAVSVAAWPNEIFRGPVFFIAPFVDTTTRTVLVKAEIPNPDFRLKPGMFASLDLTLRIRDDAMVIPEAALNQILDASRATIMVVTADETVAVRPIRLGMRLPGRVEVLEGLDGSERVVVEGLQKLAPGMKVREAPPGSADPYLRSAPKPD